MMTGLPFHTLVVVIRIITYHNDDTCEPRQPTTDNPLSSELNIELDTHTHKFVLCHEATTEPS